MVDHDTFANGQRFKGNLQEPPTKLVGKNPWFPKILPFTHPLNFARKLSNLSGVFDARRAMECCAALSCVALSFNLGRRDFRTRCRKIWDMGEG